MSQRHQEQKGRRARRNIQSERSDFHGIEYLTQGSFISPDGPPFSWQGRPCVFSADTGEGARATRTDRSIHNTRDDTIVPLAGHARLVVELDEEGFQRPEAVKLLMAHASRRLEEA